MARNLDLTVRARSARDVVSGIDRQRKGRDLPRSGLRGDRPLFTVVMNLVDHHCNGASA